MSRTAMRVRGVPSDGGSAPSSSGCVRRWMTSSDPDEDENPRGVFAPLEDPPEGHLPDLVELSPEQLARRAEAQEAGSAVPT